MPGLLHDAYFTDVDPWELRLVHRWPARQRRSRSRMGLRVWVSRDESGYASRVFPRWSVSALSLIPCSLALVTQRVDVADRLATVGDHHRQIDQHPAPIMARSPATAGQRT